MTIQSFFAALHRSALSIHSSNLRRDINTNEVCEMFILRISPTNEGNFTCTIQPSVIDDLLRPFSAIFDPPTGLPPPRSSDHRIVIQPGMGPTNVRPYRCPHFQKGEISRMIKHMLKEGIIQPSRSLFSSPVLLVWKKMGHGTSASIIESSTASPSVMPTQYPPSMNSLMNNMAQSSSLSLT